MSTITTRTPRPVIRVAVGTVAFATAMAVAPFGISAASADSTHAACPPSQSTHQCRNATSGSEAVPGTAGVTAGGPTQQTVEVVATEGPVVKEGISPVPDQTAKVPVTTVRASEPELVVGYAPVPQPTVVDPNQDTYVASTYGPIVTGGYAPVPDQNAKVPTPDATPTATPQQVPHQVPHATPNATPVLKPERVVAVSNAGATPTALVNATAGRGSVAAAGNGTGATVEPTGEPVVTTTTVEPDAVARTAAGTTASSLSHTGVENSTLILGGAAAVTLLAGVGVSVAARRRQGA